MDSIAFERVVVFDATFAGRPQREVFIDGRSVWIDSTRIDPASASFRITAGDIKEVNDKLRQLLSGGCGFRVTFEPLTDEPQGTR